MESKRFYRSASCLIGTLLFTVVCSVSAQDKQASWIQKIRSSDSVNRIGAIYQLPDKPLIDQTSASSLLLFLNDPDPGVRKAVIIALGEWKIHPELAVPGLVKLVRDQDESVREQAVVALSKYGEYAAPALIKLLDNTSEDIKPLVRIGKDDQTTLKVSDLAMIGLIDSPVTVLPLLMNAYRGHKTSNYRTMIRYVLARNRYMVAEDLLPYLTSDDPDIRVLALGTLGRFHARAEMALSSVVKLLKDNDVKVRHAALETLCRIGKGSLPIVLQALKEGLDPEAKELIIERAPEMHAAGIAVLLEIISSSTNPGIRARAARKIPEVRDYITDGGGILSKAMLDPNKEMASMAAYALDYVCNNDSTALSVSDLSNLLKALRSPVGEVQGRAADILSRQKHIGAVKKQAADVIIILLNRSNQTGDNGFEDEPRRDFIHALALLEPGSSRVVSTMENLLANNSLQFLAEDIVDVLGDFGPSANSVVPLILKRLKAADEYDKVKYLESLANIQPHSLESLLFVIGSARYDNETKISACQVIGDRVPVGDTVKTQLRTIADKVKDTSSLKIPLIVALYRTGDQSERTKQILLSGMRSGRQSRDIFEGLTSNEHTDTVFLVALWEAAKVDDRPTFLQELIRVKGNQIVKDIWLNCLTDPDKEIRETALRLLMKSGPGAPELPGSSAVLTTALEKVISMETGIKKNFDTWEGSDGIYTAVSQPIFPAFDIIIRMGPEARPLIPALKPLLAHPNPRIRLKAAESIGAIGVDTLQLKPVLLKMLGDSILWVSKTASESLVRLRIDLDSMGVEFSSHVIDNYIREHFSNESLDIADYFRPSYLVSGRMPQGLPPFPWPPPKYSNIARFGNDIPLELIGNDQTRLYDIYLKLIKAMKDVDINFEHGLFGAPGGIAILTKMERVNDEGKPLPGKYRWMTGKLAPLSLTDYIGQLFFENAGYFREIVFVFTNEQNFGSSNKTLPDIKTGGDFPKELMGTTLKDVNGYVLVYSFKRVNGGVLTSFAQVSAAAHLQDSGIFPNIH